jgi:hypothetical protein
MSCYRYVELYTVLFWKALNTWISGYYATKKRQKNVPLLVMQALRGREVQLLLILDLDTRKGSVQRHALAAFCPREATPCTQWTVFWMGLRAGLDTEARGKILCLCQGSNPSRPVCSQTLYWLSYPTSQKWHSKAVPLHAMVGGEEV